MQCEERRSFVEQMHQTGYKQYSQVIQSGRCRMIRLAFVVTRTVKCTRINIMTEDNASE